jgi:hypothetical protein
MRNGEVVYEGAAACGYQRLGSQFLLLGDVSTCADTGSAVWGDHVDWFFHDHWEGWRFLREFGDRHEVHWLAWDADDAWPEGLRNGAVTLVWYRRHLCSRRAVSVLVPRAAASAV